MKLSEALSQRKELKDAMTRAADRMQKNARTPESEGPSEDYEHVRGEYEEYLSRWEALVVAINVTNAQALIPETQMTITQAVARRDVLKMKIRTLQQVSSAATDRDYFRGERGKFKVNVPVRELEQEINTLSRQYRELDTQIQAANFQVDLVEVALAP